MSLPMSERVRTALQEAGRERGEFANRIQEILEIDGVDYTYALQDFQFEGKEDAPAVLLEATLGIRLPTEGAASLSRRELTLTLVIEGDGQANGEASGSADENFQELLVFRGRVVEVYAQGRFTYVSAATGGYAVKRSIKRTLDYLNASPALVLFDALSDLPYDGIEISPTEHLDESSARRSRINATGDEAFRPLDKRSDLLSVVREEARLIAADRPDNVATVYSEASIVGDGSEALDWGIEEGRDCDFGAIGVETSERERFHSVVAYTEREDGTQTEIARAVVDNHGVPVDPQDTLELLFSYSTEGNPTTEDVDSAFEMVFREAEKLSLAPVTLIVPLVYRPHHIVRGDAVPVTMREFTVDEEGIEGEWIREYLMRVDSLSGGRSRKDGQLSGAAELVEKRFISYGSNDSKAGRSLASGASPSVSEAYGRDHRGRIRFSSALPWVSVADGSEVANGIPYRLVRFDVQLAREYGVEIAEIAEGMTDGGTDGETDDASVRVRISR